MDEKQDCETPLSHRRLLQFITDHCIFRAPEHRITSTSGKVLDWLVDLRLALLDPGALDDITTLFWDSARHWLPFQVGGLETASNHLVTGIQSKGVALGHAVGGFVIRKAPKGYGRGQWLEGRIDATPIVLVDDLMKSGKSFGKATQALATFGRRPHRCFTVVDFQSRAGTTWLAENRLELHALYKLDHLGLERRGRAATRPTGYMPVWQHRGVVSQASSQMVPKSTPSCVGSCVIYCDPASVSCLALQDGAPIWRFAVHGAGERNPVNTADRRRPRLRRRV